MFRLVCMFMGALLIGVVAGSQLQIPASPIESVSVEKSESSDLESIYRESLEGKEDLIRELTTENDRLDSLVSTLEEAAAKMVPIEANPETGQSLELDMVITDATLESEVSDRRRGREPRTEEDRARMEEFRNQARDRMIATWDKEWEKASPESQARITAIADFQQDLMDIGMEMRQAETDEEREAILEDMRTTREAMNQTLSLERDAQLGNLAEKYGITDEKKVEKFVRDTQKTLNSPVFQTSTGRGGGFGGFGGGRGGSQGGRR